MFVTLCSICFSVFLSLSCTVAEKIVALKSIAAYRSGLEIDTEVSKSDAEKGLLEDLNGWYGICFLDSYLWDGTMNFQLMILPFSIFFSWQTCPYQE